MRNRVEPEVEMAVQQKTTATGCCEPLASTRFDGDDAAELAKGFHALADPVRLHLLSMITVAGAAGACVCDLTEPSGRSQPTVSHHLKILREAGLVTAEKRGKWAWYFARPERLATLRSALG
jgi:ArsR family transcriptional regulator, arsenate/arsenite/antimonite-responsive transcriptional repressor